MRARGYPEAALAVLHRAVLAGEVDALALFAVTLTALREVTGAGGEFGFDGCVGGNPVGESVFAVLDDTRVIMLAAGLKEGHLVREAYALLASYPS